MKKITILLFIIFTFLFSTTSWGDWNYVTESEDGDKVYYDKDRVRKSEKYIYLWMLVDYLKPTKDGDVSVTTYTELDCSIFRYKGLKFLRYKNSMGEGIPTSDFTPPDEWLSPQPDTVIESMYKKICEEHQ